MVSIPKIVLKSQTRLTLNERFTQFGEQQKARLQMLKNDLQTRIVEESFQNGSHGSVEMSEKLEKLARDIENPERHQALFSKKRRLKERPYEISEVHEEPIVPEYRSLLYRGGRRNPRVGKPRSSKRPVTYGDVLNSDHNGEEEVSHWRAEALRGVKPGKTYGNPNKYVNPLMRDSDEEDAEFAGAGQSAGISVHSRLGMKQSTRPRTTVYKKRENQGAHRRAASGSRASNHPGGGSTSRQKTTKEDLDRELDEYRQKGSVMDVEMSAV